MPRLFDTPTLPMGPPPPDAQQALAPDQAAVPSTAQESGDAGAQAVKDFSATQTAVTPQRLKDEAGANKIFRNAAQQVHDIDVSKMGNELTGLESGRDMPFTSRDEDDVIVRTLIPAIRESVEFDQHFRQNLIQNLRGRVGKYKFASPQIAQILGGVLTKDNIGAYSNAVNILGMYEGQRRVARMTVYDAKKKEYYQAYEQLRDAIDASSMMGVAPGRVAQMTSDLDKKMVKNFHGAMQFRAATRNLFTNTLAEGFIKNLNDLESRGKAMGKIAASAQDSLSRVKRSMSASAFTRSQGYRNLQNAYALVENPVDQSDVGAMKAAGFSDPWSYRMYELANAFMGGDNEIVQQMRPIMQAKNPQKALMEAVKTGKISPEETYGVALGMFEMLQTMAAQTRQAELAKTPNPMGRGIRSDEFRSLLARLLPFLTEPVMTSHVDNAIAINRTLAAITQSPRDLREAVSDLTGDTTGDLSVTAKILEAFKTALPAVAALYDHHQDVVPVLSVRAYGHAKAVAARAEGNQDDHQSLLDTNNRRTELTLMP